MSNAVSSVPKTLAEWASWYAENGLAVFPLRPESKDPITPHGFKDATTDAEQVRRWWGNGSPFNIGIATGAMSGGLLVIDCDVDEDRDEDGLRTLNSWEGDHGEMPATSTVITGRGGQHLLYRTTEQIGCSQDQTEDKHIGIDIRCNGGYIVAPPSVHPNGNTYELEDYFEDVPIAEADENVLEFVRWVQENSKKGNGATNHDAGGGKTYAEGFNLPDVIMEGERDKTLFDLARYLHRTRVSKDVAKELVQAVNLTRCTPAFDRSIVDKKVNSAYRYKIGTINRCVDAIEDDGQLHWMDGNVRRCSFAYNVFSQRRFVTGPLPWDETGIERPWTPDDDLLALAHAQTVCAGGNDSIKSALSIVARRSSYDPVMDMLLGGGLPTWDRVPRVETMLVDLMGCEDTPYTRNAWSTFMAGAFMRAVQPGIKFDLMALLYGPQGCGKSTFSELCAINSDWYLDGPRDLTDVANAAREMSGKLICEQSELASMRKADIEPLKAAITRTHDEFVDKWQVTPSVRPRRCVFIGTTNNRQVLRDQTGNRRFLIFECAVTRPRVSVFSDEGRQYVLQAWAELAARYREGGNKAFRVHLLPAVERDADVIRERFAELDEVTESIQTWLEEYAGDVVCAAQVATNAMGVSRERYASDKQLQRRVTSALDHKCAGWSRADRKQYVSGWGSRVAWVRRA